MIIIKDLQSLQISVLNNPYWVDMPLNIQIKKPLNSYQRMIIIIPN